VLDWNTVPGADPEYKLSRLCHMVLQAHRLDIVYGLRLPGHRIAPNRGDVHHRVCLKALALFGRVSQTG